MKRLALACGWLLTFIPPAYALPGQSLKTVMQWVAHNPLISKPQETDDGEGSSLYYICVISQWSPNLLFSIHPNWKTKVVYQENLSYKHSSSVSGVYFERQPSNGLKLISQLYGQAIANDFRNARYTTNIKGKKVYQGRRFSYTVSADATHDVTQFVGHQDFLTETLSIRRINDAGLLEHE